MGVNATVVATSSVAGPTLAAGILSAADWPWLFAVNIPVGITALVLSYRHLPQNSVRVRDHRFDWRDAVMNALTFGLLMASVEGFSHGVDLRIIAAGVAALAPDRLPLHPPPAARGVSHPAVRPAANPDLPGFGRHVDLLVPRADARPGRPALLPAARLRLRRREHRTAAHGMARRHHGRRPRGRHARRKGARRTARRRGTAGHDRRALPAGLLARAPHRLRDRLAPGALRRRLRLFQSPNNSILIASAPPSAADRPAACSPRPASWGRPPAPR